MCSSLSIFPSTPPPSRVRELDGVPKLFEAYTTGKTENWFKFESLAKFVNRTDCKLKF